MALRIGFGYEQPEPGDPGLYIYDDVTLRIVASSDTSPSDEEVRRIRDSRIMTDPQEIEKYHDSKTFIRQFDGATVDRHGNVVAGIPHSPQLASQ
jgi:hypothetical protein